MTKEEFTKIIKKLQIAYSKKMSHEQMTVYYNALKNKDYVEIDEQADSLILNLKYFPTIAELVKEKKETKPKSVTTPEWIETNPKSKSGKIEDEEYSELEFLSAMERLTGEKKSIEEWAQNDKRD